MKTAKVYQVCVSWIDYSQDFDYNDWNVPEGTLFFDKKKANRIADLEFQKLLKEAEDYTHEFVDINGDGRSIEYINRNGDTADIQVYIRELTIEP